jgi:hypothetical protein
MSDTSRVHELWGVVRLQAEGSDWGRDLNEPLEAWAKRRLVRCNALERQNAELRIALQHMLEVFAKPHNETLLEVIAAREAIRRAEG